MSHHKKKQTLFYYGTDTTWKNIEEKKLFNRRSAAILKALKNSHKIDQIFVINRSVPEKLFSRILNNLFKKKKCKDVFFSYPVPEIKNKWTVIPNILSEDFANKDFVSPPKSGFNLITIGSLDDNKNQILSLQALVNIKNELDVNLRIVGSGPNKNKLEKFAEEKGLQDRVTFTGQLPVKSVIESIDEAHLFVLTSQYETFGVVVIEALSRGRPVVTTPCKGPEEVVCNENGIILQENTPEHLAQVISEMHTSYSTYNLPEIRKGALSKYGSSNIAQKLTAAYKEVCS